MATDLDDGEPGAYNLPSPTTAKALAAALPPTKDKNGAPGANSAIDTEDEARWVERAGWAPRFGAGVEAAAADAEPSLADHQTWVEGKLDDKFFGGKSL